MTLRSMMLTVLTSSLVNFACPAQSAMINISGRERISLNGEWEVIVDPTGSGEWRQVWQEKQAQKKTDFVEYSFAGAPKLNVPGDFNSRMCELKYYEGTVWYKKEFNCKKQDSKRLFLHFGAVNYKADVYLNGEKLGSHEGGFTPFQFEVTGKVMNGPNSLIVKVNNERLKNGVPSLGYDWLNYGGITRDVDLVTTGSTYIEDYFIGLKKGSLNKVQGWIRLNGLSGAEGIRVKVSGLGKDIISKTDKDGFAGFEFTGDLKLWSPDDPKLYSVQISCETDTLRDEIGFRNIEVHGNKILLNGKEIFLKGVNIHEENPIKACRANSPEDAFLLIGAAKELGCNLVRLAHYPHNEYTVKEAERMGIMVWSEIPVYQHIEFSDTAVPGKIELMMKEMIRRDRNRCAVILWSLSNETYPSSPGRNEVLSGMSAICRSLDSTRLIAHVINSQGYNNNTVDVRDPLYNSCDIVAVNEYLGWYVPWQGKPEDTKWKTAFPGKPLFISEFGGEALYGNNTGPADEASSWNEDYQEGIFKDQVNMFRNIPDLCGVCPWLLFDYRSPVRMHPVYQKGYNRKGLISEKGEKKKAWYIMHRFYTMQD
jgi:beta-glucuronidase